MNLSIFRRRVPGRHATPQHHPVTVPVNVTVARREARPDGLASNPPTGWRPVTERGKPTIPDHRAALMLSAYRVQLRNGPELTALDKERLALALDAAVEFMCSRLVVA